MGAVCAIVLLAAGTVEPWKCAVPLCVGDGCDNAACGSVGGTEFVTAVACPAGVVRLGARIAAEAGRAVGVEHFGPPLPVDPSDAAATRAV